MDKKQYETARKLLLEERDANLDKLAELAEVYWNEGEPQKYIGTYWRYHEHGQPHYCVLTEIVSVERRKTNSISTRFPSFSWLKAWGFGAPNIGQGLEIYDNLALHQLPGVEV
jgi:hypothetical protein